MDNNARTAVSISSLKTDSKQLEITWSDGFKFVFHPLWLRESSNHPDYRDPGTNMRIPQASALPLDLSLVSANTVEQQQRIELEFSDGHRCSFAQQSLYSSATQQRPEDLSGDKKFWDSSFTEFQSFNYDQIHANQHKLLEILNIVAQTGFAHIKGMPVEANAVKHFANLVGPIRETNWGTVTDVRNMPNPYDLTVTTRSLSPHVDNPYRLPAPGYIFMHCLKNDANGGESTMVDGFAAAMRLKQTDEDAFDALTEISPNFRHAEASAILEDYGPMIQINEAGEVVRIRFSNRTEQIPPLDVDTLNRYYRARKAFAQIIFSKQMTLLIKLKPGDGFIWDNYRILHGRNAFDINTGDRHMRHCYMDRDTVSSRHKCLIRELGQVK